MLPSAIRTAAYKGIFAGLFTGLCTFSFTSQAAGLLSPTNTNLPDLSIRAHHVNVTIEDGYAVTQVEQVFANPHNQPLDALYSFPVPKDASVGEFTYWINNKPVTAEVVSKQAGRKIYQQEKSSGNKTALVEQNSYKTFNINMAAVQPGQDARIKLVYIQPAEIDHGIGRYVYPLEDGGVDEAANSFWNRNEKVEGDFSFNLNVRSSYPLDGVRVPNQPNAQVTRINDHEWRASLATSAATAVISADDNTAGTQQASQHTTQTTFNLDKDLVTYWRHQANLPGSLDLTAYRADKNSAGTFMLTLTPGDDLPAITQGRDWIFVLDISGSMRGKYLTLVEGVRQGLHKLNPQDRFRIVLFNDRAQHFTQGFEPATPPAINAVLNRLAQHQTSNGTNLYAGLSTGLNSVDSDRPSAVVLVTDGVANVGKTEKRDFIDELKAADVRLFTFIMGNSANRPLLEEMTHVSNGFAQHVSNADDILGHIAQAASKLNHLALRDIKLELDGVAVRDLTPKHPNSLYRGEQLMLMGHYLKAGPLKVTLSGMIGDKPQSYTTTVQLPETATRNPELERLWAYATISDLQNTIDYLGPDADTEQAISDIATQYSLVTDYTSMIVVEEDRYEALGIKRTNAKRVETENKARTDRAQAPVQQPTQTSQPMFDKSRATVGGGGGAGAIDLSQLLIMISAIGAAWFGNRRRKSDS